MSHNLLFWDCDHKFFVYRFRIKIILITIGYKFENSPKRAQKGK